MWLKTELCESAHGVFGELRNSRLMTQTPELISAQHQFLHHARASPVMSVICLQLFC